MNKYTIATDTIKASVSTLDVANVLGWEVNHKRCKCPIHSGNDFNCRLYDGDRGYHCFSCGDSGDVIKLVQVAMFGGQQGTFRQAIAWFNATFNLGMNIDSPMSEEAVKQAENARRKREREREFREWKERMRFDLALTADQIVKRLEEMRDQNRPRQYGEPWNKEFRTAVELLPEARMFAEDCMMECIRNRG